MSISVSDILAYTHSQEACLNYRGPVDKKGYTRISVAGKVYLTHRYIWELVNGPIPAGHVIMHTCDNPTCVNIAHLKCGTQAENLADAKKKGRVACGSKLPQAILTEEQVKSIWNDLKAQQLTQREIAKKYGIHFAIVSDIKLGKTWKSVTSK